MEQKICMRCNQTIIGLEQRFCFKCKCEMKQSYVNKIKFLENRILLLKYKRNKTEQNASLGKVCNNQAKLECIKLDKKINLHQKELCKLDELIEKMEVIE